MMESLGLINRMPFHMFSLFKFKKRATKKGKLMLPFFLSNSMNYLSAFFLDE